MRVLRFITKRLILLIPILIGLVTVTFFISHILPGDPVTLAAGEAAPPETVERLRREFGFDQPLWVQYGRFWSHLAHGDLGRSLLTRRPVTEDIIRFFPATLELAIVALIIAVLVGVSSGVVSAVRQGGFLDHALRVLSISGVSLPRFWLALLLQVLAFQTGLLPISGRIDTFIPPPQQITGLYLVDSLLTANWAAFWSSAAHIILPALSMAFAIIGLTQRMTRANMLDVLTQDYVLNAYAAAGLPRTIVNFKYALKSALIPVVSQVALSLGFLLSGSLLVETVYNWPGIGLYIVNAANYNDYQPVIGGVILTGVIFVMVNLIADILYTVLDPRIEYGKVT
ncbi:MAG TPA: peptide ABC transporter permease [Chloroflexi bacterium]|nr:peptide ABC transporter permease [Chloroflexota bacterium]